MKGSRDSIQNNREEKEADKSEQDKSFSTHPHENAICHSEVEKAEWVHKRD